MEDDARKRKTDCVYYLASLLTCKKGSECEYRHSESARLNPRDCRYWLNGNCLNPSCAFRHPPLEGLSETVAEPSKLSSHATIAKIKADVPCYFFFNAYCIKGDHCPFMHGALPPQQLPKAAPDTTDIYHPSENKASTGSETGPASIEVPANPPADTPELTREENSKEVHRQAPGIAVEEHSPSAELSVPDCEEAGIKLSNDYVLPSSEYMNGSPQLFTDKGSEENVKANAGTDEWWESSPGLDVLVNDGSEQLAYEEDGDCLLARGRESEMLHEHLQCAYEVPPRYYLLAYPEAGFMYKHGGYDGYDQGVNRYTPEYLHKVAEYSSERRDLETVYQRRKPSRRRHEMVDGRDFVDLRDHLRRCRRTDVSTHKHYSSQIRAKSLERPKRHQKRPSRQGRSASEVRNNMYISAQRETDLALSDSCGIAWSRYIHSSRNVPSRPRERENRRRKRRPPPLLSSQILHGFYSKRAESSGIEPSDVTFSGPKTLAQIKEEKRRAREADGNGSESRTLETGAGRL